MNILSTVIFHFESIETLGLVRILNLVKIIAFATLFS